MKIIILMMLFVGSVFAQEIEVSNGIELPSEMIPKSVMSIKDGLGKAIININIRNVWGDNYRIRDFNSDFISNLTATMGARKVLDASFAPYLFPWSTVAIGFQFKDTLPYSKTLIYTLTDNHGRMLIKPFPISRKDVVLSNTEKMQKYEYSKGIHISKKAWNETSIEAAIKELYGQSAFNIINTTDNEKYFNKKVLRGFSTSNGINHDAGAPLYIKIEGQKAFESIAIFSSTTPTALLAVFQVPKGEIIDISVPFYLKKDGKILVVGKSNDGKLYQSESFNVLMNTRGEDDFSTAIAFEFLN